MAHFRGWFAVCWMTLVGTLPASATVFTFYDGIAAGRALFDKTVRRAGASPTNDVWASAVPGLSEWQRPGYTVRSNDGSELWPMIYGVDLYGIDLDAFHPTLSGYGVALTVGDGTSGIASPLGQYFEDGITLTFDTPINAFGIEVGDWGTCCWLPTSDLLLSFDGRAPIVVASVDYYTEYKAQQPSQFDPNLISHSVFVAAFDDSGSFSTVSIWGNRNGEALVFGGDVRWSHLAQGSLAPAIAETPLPAAGLSLATALIAMGALCRRRRHQA